MTMLYVVIACGLLSILYAIWATQSVLAADQGNARMQEIAGAIREGAQAYLTRQYTTIAIVGVVVFLLAWWLLSGTAAIGIPLVILCLVVRKDTLHSAEEEKPGKAPLPAASRA